MTRFLMVLTLMGSLFFTGEAFAFRASAFRGAYEVFQEQNLNKFEEPAPKKYVIVDVDTVAAIWARYGEGPLPPSLTPIAAEPSVLLGFTFRDGIIFNLEAKAIVMENLLAMPAGENDLMNLKRQPDGRFQLGVRIKGQTKMYQLGPREDL